MKKIEYYIAHPQIAKQMAFRGRKKVENQYKEKEVFRTFSTQIKKAYQNWKGTIDESIPKLC